MRFLRLLATAAALHAATLAHASDFPAAGQTLRIVVPFAAGGGVDQAARVLGEELRQQLNLSVIVENRPGASGTLGAKHVQNAAPDGYTLLFSAATQIMAGHVLKQPPYDPEKDFTPVARVGEAPLLLAISPSHAGGNLDAVLTQIRQSPNPWTAAIPAIGAPSHLATLLLAQRSKTTFSLIPYKGTQPALIDVAGGHVDVLFDSMISMLPMAQSGKVKPIAISSRERSPLAPEIATLSESGLPDFSYASWYGLWAPPATPADRVQALNTAVNKAVTQLQKTGALASLGITPVIESPQAFASRIAADIAQGGELLQRSGFKPE